MKCKVRTSMLLLLTLLLTGCSSMNHRWSDPGACLRNKCIAHHAWHQWKWCYEDVEHRHHFGKGFRAGYRDVLEGGKGCQPTLPPRCYWKSCYRSAEGRCKVNAWFDGFSHGALAAQQDGIGNWNQIPLSPTARANLRLANSRPHSNHWNGQGPPPPIASPAPPAAPQPLILQDPPRWDMVEEDDDDEDVGVLDLPADDESLPVRPYE